MNTFITSPAASPAPVSTPLTQFISQIADLRGLPVEQLIPALNARLSQTPLHYADLLTGTALLRTVQSLAGTDLSAHYVLLVRGEQIVGLTMIPTIDNRVKPDQGPLICYHDAETRPLMRAIVEHDATRAFLATVRTDEDYLFDTNELWEINRLREALETFEVELLEYLLFYPDLNVSWVWTEQGQEGLDDGVAIGQLEFCGLPDEVIADQSTTSTLG